MSTAISEPDSEAAILARVVVVVASLNPEAARGLLGLRFSEADGRRMTQRTWPGPGTATSMIRGVGDSHPSRRGDDRLRGVPEAKAP